MMTMEILKARRRARKRIERVDFDFQVESGSSVRDFFHCIHIAYTEFTCRRCIACEADTNIYRLVPCLVFHNPCPCNIYIENMIWTWGSSLLVGICDSEL